MTKRFHVRSCLLPRVEAPPGARCSRPEACRSLPAPRVPRRSLPRHALLTHASVAALFGLHCAAMLRAARAPVVGYHGPRGDSSCAERHVVNSFVAPARTGRLQPPLGLRCALRLCSLRVPAPHLALRARRESASGASLRVRSRGEGAAEVRLVLCLTVLSFHVGLWCCRCRRLARPSRCG